MYELIQVSEDCYYINCPAKIGVVKTGERDVCLIDSGNDKDAGKKIKKILDAQEWTLKAIYNTHSHADHIGGNKYLQTQTGCRVYAPGIERDFTEHPILEAAYLFGGNPPKALRHKFIMAQDSDATPLTEEALPEGWKVIPLPGHDKTFAVGLQFHPEAAIVKHLENAANKDDYMSYDMALSIFQWIVQEDHIVQEEAA